MTIEVIHNEFRNWETPVSVQLGYWEDGEFIVEECNHASTEVKDYTFDQGGSFEHSSQVEVCTKNNCQAWRIIGEEEWRNHE